MEHVAPEGENVSRCHSKVGDRMGQRNSGTWKREEVEEALE